MRKRVRELGVLLKRTKDSIARPFVFFFDLIGFSPTVLSLFSLFFGLAAAATLIYSRDLFLGFMIVSFLFDMFDGALARYQRGSECSKEFDDSIGFWIDYFVDRTVVFAVTFAVLIMNWGGEAVYYFVPGLYLLSHLIYSKNRRVLQYLYVHPIYLVILYFDVYYATVFFAIACSINILLFSGVLLRKRLKAKN